MRITKDDVLEITGLIAVIGVGIVLTRLEVETLEWLYSPAMIFAFILLFFAIGRVLDSDSADAFDAEQARRDSGLPPSDNKYLQPYNKSWPWSKR